MEANQIIRDPRFRFSFEVIKAGTPDCKLDGINTLSCSKKISPLVPRNGISVSIRNALGVNTEIQKVTEKGQKCFEIRRVKPQGSAEIGEFLGDLISGSFGLPGQGYATFVVLYNGTKQGCASYSLERDKDGIAYLNMQPTEKEFKLFLSDSVRPDKNFNFVLTVEGVGSRFAIASAPRFDNNVLNSFKTRVSDPVEPFVIANNLQYTPAQIGKTAIIKPKGVDGFAMKFGADYGLKIGSASGSIKLSNKADPKQYALDIVGNPTSGSDFEACSNADFCFVEDSKALESDLKDKLQGEMLEIIKTMDVVSYSQAEDFDRIMLETAMQSALQDYLTGLISSAACKELGRDPIGDLRRRCTANFYTPQQLPQNMGDAFSGGFLAAACDSEVLNLASAAASGTVGVPGGYINILARRLVQQYLLPGSAEIPVAQRIFRELDTTINIPVKIAGENGGFVI